MALIIFSVFSVIFSVNYIPFLLKKIDLSFHQDEVGFQIMQAFMFYQEISGISIQKINTLATTTMLHDNLEPKNNARHFERVHPTINQVFFR